MNFRKITSGIAALAMAAASFAGLSITASASAYTNPYELDTGEVIGRVMIGTKSADGLSVTPEDFSSYTSTYTSTAFAKSIGTRNSTYTETNYPSGNKNNVYAFEYGLALPTAANSSNSYPLISPVTEGKLVLRGDIINPERQEYIEINGTDTSGNPITVFKFTCSNSGSGGNPGIQIGSTNISSTAGTVRPSIKTRYEGTTIDYVIVDLETRTVEYKYDGVAYWSSAYHGFYTGTSSETISDLASVTGITLGQSHGSKSNKAPTFDNVAMYTVGNGYHTLSIDAANLSAAEKENLVITFDGETVSNGTVSNLINGTYNFTAVHPDYHRYSGSVTVDGTNVTESFTMTPKTPVESITVNYRYGGNVIKTVNLDIEDAGLRTEDSYSYTSVNYIQANNIYYYVAGDYTERTQWSDSTSPGNSALRQRIDSLQTANTITYNVTPVTSGNIVFYAEGESGSIMPVSTITDWSSHTRWVASGDHIGFGYYNSGGHDIYTAAKTGKYQVTMVLKSAGRNTEIYYEDNATGDNTTIVKNTENQNGENGFALAGTTGLIPAETKIMLKSTHDKRATDDIDYIVIRDITEGTIDATVTVTDKNAAPISGATVIIAGYTATETETPGTYTVKVPEGTHNVAVLKGGYVPNTGSVTVSEGGTNTTAVELTDAYTVTYDISSMPSGCSYSGELSETVADGSNPASVPTITDNLRAGGNAFLGWAETAGGTTYVSPKDIAISGNKTYYAVFSDTIRFSRRYYASADSNTINSGRIDIADGFYIDNNEICLWKGQNRGFISFDNLDTTTAVAATMNIYITKTPTRSNRTYGITFAKTSTPDWGGRTADTLNEGSGWGSNKGSSETTIATVSYQGDSGDTVVTGWKSGKFTDISDMDKLYINSDKAADHRFSSIEGGNPAYIEIFYTGYEITCGGDSITVPAGAYADDTVTISPAYGCRISGTPVVTQTGGAGTAAVSEGGTAGTYTFTMPAYPVTVNSFAYSIPEEVTYNTDSTTAHYDEAERTTGDGYYARGFTFTAFSGGLTMRSVGVTISGTTPDTAGANITNNTATGTSTAALTSITGDAIFGIMIWTNKTEKINDIKTFDPVAGIGITIE